MGAENDAALMASDVPGPILLVTPPIRSCLVHGDHPHWMQFRFDEPYDKQPHWCMRCIVAALPGLGVMAVSDP